ncbi:hypothetical protein AB0O01_00875 [Streptomyces sp. NPDC093252]|uniref:hypothetical protein n=1 Tax=Streptomyces sp. NPDC093252 TaxID=3154980 RepID=UPI00341F0207
MPRTHVDILVTHAQFYLAELCALDMIDNDMYRGFNGLVSAHTCLAIVMTGTESGHVSLTADWRAEEPPLDLTAWESVVDVSMVFEEEPGALSGPRDEDGRGFPQLAPGSYRVRFHARGRDRGSAQRNVPGSPVEEHLVAAWPAPPAPETCHKLGDLYGAEVRAR